MLVKEKAGDERLNIECHVRSGRMGGSIGLSKYSLELGVFESARQAKACPEEEGRSQEKKGYQDEESDRRSVCKGIEVECRAAMWPWLAVGPGIPKSEV